MGKQDQMDISINTLRIFWRHARIYWPMLLICAAGISLLIAADTISPLMYKRFFDQLGIDPIHKSPRAGLSEISKTIGFIAVAAFCSLIGWRACLFAVIRFESAAMKDLTDTCFTYLQNHS